MVRTCGKLSLFTCHYLTISAYSRQLVVEKGSVERVQSDCMQNKIGIHHTKSYHTLYFMIKFLSFCVNVTLHEAKYYHNPKTN